MEETKPYMIQCITCGEWIPIIGVPFDKAQAFNSLPRRARPFVQDQFPNLSPDIREMFISAICPSCWIKTFGEPEEE